MQTTVIVPIYKNQLVTLYRQGFNTIDSSRIIFAKLENDLPIIPEGILASKLPVFEEDFEVLLIEFDLSFFTQIIQNEITILPNLKQPLEISFQDIKRIYPLSERGAKSLNLGEKIKLEKPIFEKEVKKAEQSFKLKGYFQGGFALLKIMGLENSLIKQDEQNLKETFIDAYNFRSNPKVKAGDMPKTNNNLLKVLCYERYGGIIPENDLGFLCDTGFLFAQTQSDKIQSATDSPFVVALIKGNENEFKNFNLSQLLNLLETKYQNLKEKMKVANFHFATYFFYFKIKAILNEGKQVSKTSLPQIVKEFKDTEYKNNLITAVWLAGSFFGFSRFFSEFYQETPKQETPKPEKKSSQKVEKETEKKNLTIPSKINSVAVSQNEEVVKIEQSEELTENAVTAAEQTNEVIEQNKNVPLEITNTEQLAEPNSENKDGLFANNKDEKKSKK
jgi:hypothetical protein